MPERPLLILPAPGRPERRIKKKVLPGKTHLPTRGRQTERLTPRFTALQQAFDAQRARLRTEAVGLAPEQVIVLETVGSVEGFIVAVRNITGLEWLGQVEEEDVPPDEDFFVADRTGTARRDKTLRGQLFLVFSSQQVLQQLLSLWDKWKAGRPMPFGLGKLGDVFSRLRDIRLWGVQDRLLETGVLNDWRERVEHNDEVVPCEIELWFRNNPRHRRAARDRVTNLINEMAGHILQEAIIEEIAYHAILVRLPVGAVQTLLGERGRDAALVQCEQVQFFRASGQMAGVIMEDTRVIDVGRIEPVPATIGNPVVALFDGLPLQNHHRLAGRLIVDDPDGYEAQYPANERRHGTAMASLILHGDIDAGEIPLSRRLYVRPILRPDPRDWRPLRSESVSEDSLVVDLFHRAVRRLFEGEGTEPAAAPDVCVINVSIGINDRFFNGSLSPLARLLDWLAWRYRVLFIVSAGNHTHNIEISVPRNQVTALSAEEFQTQTVRAIAADTRHRRLLSPAEAVNVITVGALHRDASTGTLPPNSVDPFVSQNLPSLINAQGMGYRRAIKPEVLLPGGRTVLRQSLTTTENAVFELLVHARPPGQRIAAPGPNPGDLLNTWYSRGTSNSTAIASRSASILYDVLEELRGELGGELIDGLPRSVWLKALLVHSATWGAAGLILDQILRNSQNSRQFKEYVTRLLGYGTIDSARVRECTRWRVTTLGGGFLQADQAHVHRFPLPPSLSGQRGMRRLTITLAWLTPINTVHQAWRRAHLWFTPPIAPLQLDRQEADWRAVQRGTIQHEILEGDHAAAFVDGDSLEILVNCRPDAGALEDPVPYAVATTLEVAETIGVDIYNEVRVRVHAARIQVTPGP